MLENLIGSRLDFVWFSAGFFFAAIGIVAFAARRLGSRRVAATAFLQTLCEWAKVLQIFYFPSWVSPLLQATVLIAVAVMAGTLAAKKCKTRYVALAMAISFCSIALILVFGGVKWGFASGMIIIGIATDAMVLSWRSHFRAIVASIVILGWAILTAFFSGNILAEAIRLLFVAVLVFMVLPLIPELLCGTALEWGFLARKISAQISWLAFAGIFIFAIGGLFVEKMGENRKQDIESSMLQRISTAAHMLDTTCLLKDRLDTSTPPEPAWSQLHSLIRGDSTIRFAYVLAERNKQLTFLVDGTDPHSSDYSAPGDVYEEASEFLKALFRNPHLAMEPVSTDKWGTWVTAWAPLKGNSGNFVGLLGMDMEANRLAQEITRSRFLGIVLTALLLFGLIALTAVIVESSRRQLSDDLSSILQNELGEGAVVLDLDGKILFANRALARLVEKGNLLGQEFVNFIGGSEARSRADRMIAKALKEGNAEAELEFEGIHRPILWSFRKYLPRPGLDPMFIGVGHDMTQVRIAQRAVEVEKTLIDHIVANAPLLVLVIGETGNLEFINPAVEQSTGHALSDLTRTDWRQTLMPPGAEWQLDQILDESWASNVVDFPMAIVGINGEKRVVSWNSVVRKDENGAVRQVILLGMDITERNQAQERLLDYAIHLKKLQGEAQQRTAELSAAYNRLSASQAQLSMYSQRLETQNAELELARLAAEQANRMKSEFLANTSHELRTPLNSIMGFLKLVMENAVVSREEELEFIQIAYDSSRHLLSLINDVLDIAKIEAGRMSVTIEDVHLSDLFTDVEALVRVQAEQKKLSLQIEPPAEKLDRIWADSQKLKQVMLNVLGNAVKFTAKGSVTMHASPAEETTSVRISIVDTGIGVAPEVQGELFQPFMQAEGGTTRKYGGTGLGLSISRRLIEMMNGKIEMKSGGIGMGTTIEIILPLWSSKR